MTLEFASGTVGYRGDDGSGRVTATGICTDSYSAPPPSPHIRYFSNEPRPFRSRQCRDGTYALLSRVIPGPMASGLGQRARPSVGLLTCTINLIPSVPNVSSMLLALSLRRANGEPLGQPRRSHSARRGSADSRVRHATTRPDSGGCTDSHNDASLKMTTWSKRLAADRADHPLDVRPLLRRSWLPVLPECQSLSTAW
jgi:hypothetical protein